MNHAHKKQKMKLTFETRKGKFVTVGITNIEDAHTILLDASEIEYDTQDNLEELYEEECRAGRIIRHHISNNEKRWPDKLLDIKREMSRQQITVYKLSQLTGLSAATLADILNRKSNPRTDNADLICEALEIPCFA